MRSKRRNAWSLLTPVAAGLLLALVMTRGASGDSGADEPWVEEPATEVPDPVPEQQPSRPPPNPFELAPADERAWQWEDLTDRERATMDRAQEWAETQNGADVHNAFSAAVATTSNLRRTEQAAQAAGVPDLGSLGVVP
jgi:hypothetical protein